MKYLIFGTGDYYNRYKKWFAREDIAALMDNAPQKHHTIMDGVEVLPPEEGLRRSYDVIVILSFHVREMKQQLVSLGAEEDRIFHFYDLHQLFGRKKRTWGIQYYLNAEETVKSPKSFSAKILLLSNDLALGGPSIALFHAAVALKKRGYPVVYASMLDGVLRESLTENGIPVVVDGNLQVATMGETEWISTFSLIVCNTMNFHVFLSERGTDIPVLWWLHDAVFFYGGVRREVMEKIPLANLKAVSVGPVPEAAVREFLPTLECGRLLYGVMDAVGIGVSGGTDVQGDSGKVCFTTIGFLEERKGQDILLQAIQMLPVRVREQCYFYIVGHDETMFGEEIRRKSAGIREIVFTGSINRKEIHRLLNRSDVLVCPSRQDPMPTVAAEAMMHSVPCIVSDAVGTAAYLHDGEDGFVFQNEDVAALAGKMEQCVSGKERLAYMGEKARKLYETYFSMESFESNFLNLVKDLIS